MNSNNSNIGTGAPLGIIEEPKKKKKIDLPIVPIKNTADYQRMKLERLMANPDKPVIIPERPKGIGKKDKIAPPPEFVRNIMGSSAGAGSGEFHVYRHIRRKEYARQKAIVEEARREEKETEFKRKQEESQKIIDEKRAKKRAKRQKQKEKMKKARKLKPQQGQQQKSSSSSSSEDSESDSNRANVEKEGKDQVSSSVGDKEKIGSTTSGILFDTATDKDASEITAKATDVQFEAQAEHSVEPTNPNP